MGLGSLHRALQELLFVPYIHLFMIKLWYLVKVILIRINIYCREGKIDLTFNKSIHYLDLS